MSRHAQLERQRRRAQARRFTDNPVVELSYVETLRAFVKAELPSLDASAPWTKEQLNAIDRIYRAHLDDPEWRCVQCGRVVSKFGDRCVECQDAYGPLEPVDWDSVGA